jgi:hypothetical protein
MRNLARQKQHGRRAKRALTHRVRRETDPITKPPVQDQAVSNRNLLSRSETPELVICRVAGSRMCRDIRLRETDNPIRGKLKGSAIPKAAIQGCQPFQ